MDLHARVGGELGGDAHRLLGQEIIGGDVNRAPLGLPRDEPV